MRGSECSCGDGGGLWCADCMIDPRLVCRAGAPAQISSEDAAHSSISLLHLTVMFEWPSIKTGAHCCRVQRLYQRCSFFISFYLFIFYIFLNHVTLVWKHFSITVWFNANLMLGLFLSLNFPGGIILCLRERESCIFCLFSSNST